MTDGAGLPIALSDIVATLRATELLDTTITCGHTFGGDYEAVSIYSALAVARHVARADVAVVAMGPGIVGTNTRLGFSGMEVGTILDAASALGGVPIACLRDLVRRRAPAALRALASHRDRAAGRDTRVGARRRARARRCRRGRAARAPISTKAGSAARHELVMVDAPDAIELLARHGLRIESMGRPAADDPAMFQAAAAAGTLAAEVRSSAGAPVRDADG